MADIGKSTSSHSAQTHSGRDIIRLLNNWGNWISSLGDPCSSGVSSQPMFREYVAGYRSSSKSRTAESPDVAERLDRVMATMPIKDKACFILSYAMDLSDLKAIRFLKRYDEAANMGGELTCSNKTYKVWLEKAEIDLATKIMFAEGFDLDKQARKHGMLINTLNS